MKFSIITVCKNAEDSIEKTMRSVIHQTYSDMEIIVIDGKSDDKTLELLSNYQDNIDILISEDDNGIYQAMNKAISFAKGDYLYFLNANDFFLHDSILDLVANELDKYKDVDLIYGDLLFLNGRNGRVYLNEFYFTDTLQFIQGSIIQQAFFFKRGVFDKIGLFNEYYRICSDYEWLIKALLKHRITIHHCNFPLVIFTSGGLSNNEKARSIHINERNEIIKKYFSPLQSFMFRNKIFKFIFFVRPVFVSLIKRLTRGLNKLFHNGYV